MVDIGNGNAEMSKGLRMARTENFGISSDFHTLSLAESDTGVPTALEDRLNRLEVSLNSWNSYASMMTSYELKEISRFLEAVVEVQQLTKGLEAHRMRNEPSQKQILDRAHAVLQNAMIRIEGELTTILLNHAQPMDPDTLSFPSDHGLHDDTSVRSFGEEVVHDSLENNVSSDSDAYLIDLISPGVLPYIKHMIGVMFMSDYHMECLQSYITARKDALNEFLSFLWTENLSIEEVARMDWSTLNQKIGIWIKVIKIFVRVYLVSEKHLCSLVFKDISVSACRDCFCENAKGPLMQLLNFAEAVALVTPEDRKLFRVLDVYRTLQDLLPDIESLDLIDTGSCVMTECHEILSHLADCGREIFLKVKDEIHKESSDPSARGELSRITKHIMNYIQAIVAYQESISSIFGCSDGQNLSSLCNASGYDVSCNTFSLSEHLISIMSVLEANLDAKSLFYKNPSLKHLFLMNNISYMVKKVREDSDLEYLVGDLWIKAHMGKCRRHARLYKLESWNPVITTIIDGRSGQTRKAKDMFKDFNHVFEDLYRVQTGWLIPNQGLRDDLRLSITQNLIPAYRSFFEKNSCVLDDSWHWRKYARYTPEAIEAYLCDLFMGSPKTLAGH